MTLMRRVGGITALYAVVAAVAVAAPLSASQPTEAPGVAQAPAAAPAPAAEAPAPEPAPTADAPAVDPTTSGAPAAPRAPAGPAEPAPAEPAPADPAALAPAEPTAPAAEPQVLSDEAPAKADKKSRPVAIAAASTGVTISDFQFSPATVTVNVGDTVTWTNDGPTPHSATSTSGAFDTGIMDAGQSGSHTFDQAGTFAYICTPHPNMKGTVVVQAAASQNGGGGGGAGSTTGSTGTGSQTDDGPSLPSTGMDVGGLAILGLATLALGAYLRRRTEPGPARPAGRIGW